MKTNWQTKKLGEICEIRPGKNEIKLSDDDLVSFVPMEDLNVFRKELNLHQEKKLGEVRNSYTYFANGDVLLAKITPCFENGKLGIATGLKNGIGFGSSEYIVFRSKGEILPDYLYYILSSDNFRDQGIKLMSGAVGHKRVPKDYVENFEVKLPSHSEQKRIVKILDEAFEKLQKVKENTEKNIQNSKELFESYLNLAFQNDKFPKFDFEKVCDLVGGAQPPKDSFIYRPQKGYVRLIQVRDYRSDKFTTYIPEEKAKRFCTKEDIMIGRYGPPIFGVFKGIEGSYNVALMKAVPNTKLCDKDYLYWFLKNKNLRDFVEKSSKRAAGQDGLRKELLATYPVPVPSFSEQGQIVKKIDQLSKKTQKLESLYKQKLERIEELKKSILQEAFSGGL